MDFKEYIKWCGENNLKPSNSQSLQRFSKCSRNSHYKHKYSLESKEEGKSAYIYSDADYEIGTTLVGDFKIVGQEY